MKLITKEIQKKLDGNLKKTYYLRKPYLKLFNPCGAATWFISEHDEETGIMFGLCDLGMGFVELGDVSLKELKELKLPYGLTIERDTSFKPKMSITEYADLIRKQGMGQQDLQSL